MQSPARGHWRVDTARTDEHPNGEILVTDQHMVTRGFDGLIPNHRFDEVDARGAPGAASADDMWGDSLSVTFTETPDGLIVEMLGCDALPWSATLPVVRSDRGDDEV